MNHIVVVGSLNMDVDIYCQRRPKSGETVTGREVRFVPGGKGANQAYALARMGVQTKMIGAVGQDDAGKELIRNLQSAGVDTNSICTIDTETGKAFIEIEDNGKNSIIVIAGANAAADAELVRENLPAIQKAEAVLVQLEIPLAAVYEAVRLAKREQKLVILDPAPARADLTDELLRCVDIIKPNETELSVFTQMPTDTGKKVIEAARVLIRKGIRAVLATLGEKGSILVTQDGAVCIPIYESKVVDTTAAGDCFLAAFLSRFDGSFDEIHLVEAADFAAKASAIAVSRAGAQSSIPTSREVEAFNE